MATSGANVTHTGAAASGAGSDTPPAPAPSPGPPSVWVSLCAGASAGALAKTTIAPFDRTKIYFQVTSHTYTWRAAHAFAWQSVREGGWRTLWRGNSATMARIVPYAAVQFLAHERWKRALGVAGAGSARTRPLRHLAAGALAGATSQGATYPLDVARARLAVSGTDATLGAVLGALYAEGGARSLYRGIVPTLLGVAPYAGVSFCTYEWLKAVFVNRSRWLNVVWGGVAGVLGQTASYPLDVMRRRMQVASGRRDRTLVAAAGRVLHEEGVRGFFKGLSMNWVKGPIAVGVSFATYDAIKAYLISLSAVLPPPASRTVSS